MSLRNNTQSSNRSFETQNKSPQKNLLIVNTSQPSQTAVTPSVEKEKEIKDRLSQSDHKFFKTLKHTSVFDHYRFAIVKGNNSNIIRRVLQTRPWWVEVPHDSALFHFKWAPVSGSIKFERLSKN